jgi:GGDEF domain-containing protein
MSEDNTLQTLHTTVFCYLSTLQSVADALARACPPVGGLYQHRLSRLRARLAFDANSSAIEESCALVSHEVKEYAEKASGYVEGRLEELRRTIAGLEHLVRTMAQRQDYYGERLRESAMRFEDTPCSANASLPDSGVSPVAGLLGWVDSMSHESELLLARMQDELARVEARLADAEITDPVTGLLNRRGMERCIEAARARGDSSSLLLFEFTEPLPGEVAQQAAERLSSQFRHNDLVSRWSDREFLVLFQGDAGTAQVRAEQVAPWLAGRYLLDTGATMETAVESRLVSEPVSELEPVRS